MFSNLGKWIGSLWNQDEDDWNDGPCFTALFPSLWEGGRGFGGGVEELISAILFSPLINKADSFPVKSRTWSRAYLARIVSLF